MSIDRNHLKTALLSTMFALSCGVGITACVDAEPESQEATEPVGEVNLEVAVIDYNIGNAVGTPVWTGTTCGMVDDYTPSCAGSSATDTAFYWIAPASGTYTFSTAGSAFDTVLHIYNGVGNSAPLGCNDDANGTLQSSVTLNVSAGQGLTIVVDGYGSTCGNYSLNIAGPPSGCVLTFRPGPEGKDADVFSHPSYVNQNRGNTQQLDALSWTYSGIPGTYRSYIQFDLSSISPGANVSSAKLTLIANTTPSVNLAGHSQLSGSNNGWLARVTGPWNESTVTWNNQPPVDLVNAIAVPASVSNDQTYIINVTGMVQGMVQNPGSNNGFMLRLATEQYYRALRFWSSDAAYDSQRPSLEVVLQGACP
jgi:hypothetical protein